MIKQILKCLYKVQQIILAISYKHNKDTTFKYIHLWQSDPEKSDHVFSNPDPDQDSFRQV